MSNRAPRDSEMVASVELDAEALPSDGVGSDKDSLDETLFVSVSSKVSLKLELRDGVPVGGGVTVAVSELDAETLCVPGGCGVTVVDPVTTSELVGDGDSSLSESDRLRVPVPVRETVAPDTDSDTESSEGVKRRLAVSDGEAVSESGDGDVDGVGTLVPPLSDSERVGVGNDADAVPLDGV
jgi:hypothetical protein